MMVKLQVEDEYGRKRDPVWVSIGQVLTVTIPVTFSMGGESATLNQKVPVRVLEIKDEK